MLISNQFASEKEKIVYDYYMNNYRDKILAIKEYNNLWYALDTNPNTQLVSFGNIVFFLKFQDNKVEFHSMGKENSVFAFVDDVCELVNYVKNLGVKEIYSYSNDKIFDYVLKRINRLKFNFRKELGRAPDGLTYNYYRMEL